MAIAFKDAGSFQGANGENVLQFPTQLQFGPDGRLYVTEQNGDINAFTVSIQDGEYVATDHELITVNGEGAVKALLNHNDDGSVAQPGDFDTPVNKGGGFDDRQVTGMTVAGTAENPIIYVSSSDPRIAEFFDIDIDTNSGVITQLTWNGSEWEAIDLIRGLPRSEENHSVNGLELSADGTKLYASIGGITNEGAPSAFFAYTAEYALSGAIIEIDLVDLFSRPVLTDDNATQGGNSRSYIYDLPTLDDPTDVTDGVDGPWGGNDGANQTILPADAPLRIYADGLRNAYDIVVAENGEIYTVDNGSNSGLGGAPIVVDGEATNLPSPPMAGEGENEPLFRLEDGVYYGAANPTRSNQDQGWSIYDDSGNATFTFDGSIADLVPDDVNIQDGFIIDPSKFSGDAGRLAESGQWIKSDDNPLALEILGSSSNGLVEYTDTEAFGGALAGDLFIAQFSGNVTRLDISPDGLSATEEQITGLTGLGGLPLDVTVGPDGTLWVAKYFGGVDVYAPTDLVLPGDNNFDDDGLLDVDDPFQRDATNATGSPLFAGQTLTWNFSSGGDAIFPGPSGYAAGLTGQMINGVTDFEAFLQSPSDIPGLSVNADNVKFVTAAGGGTIVVENVSSGTPNGSANSAEFFFQTGLDVVDNVESFTVSLTTLNPGNAPGSGLVGDSEVGGYIGDGTQSNFLKFVVSGNNGGEIHLVLENEDNAAVGFEFVSAPELFQNLTSAAPTFTFDLTVNRVSETATLSVTYENQVGNPQTITVPTPISLAGSNVMAAIDSEATFGTQESGLAVGLYSVDDPSNAGTFSATFTNLEVTADPVTSEGTVVARFNTGGPTIAAIDGGPDWLADAGNPALADAGSGDTNPFDVTPGGSVPPSAPAALFQTERSDAIGGSNLTYAIPVPVNGAYEVNLYIGNGFADANAIGDRIFDVALEGAGVPAAFDDLDPVALFGPSTGGVVTALANVTDGVLDIEFLHGVENPLVNAIEIVALGDVEIDPEISIAALTTPVVETGDDGTVTMASFDVTFNTPPTADVTISYSVLINGVQVSTGNEVVLAADTGAQIMVTAPNDDVNNGADTVEVVVDSIVNGPANVSIGATNSATVTISEDDIVTSDGVIIARVNAGGATLTAIDDGPDWFGDIEPTFPFALEPGGGGFFSFPDVEPGVTIDPLTVPAALFDTERSDGNAGDGIPLSYGFTVPQVGNYEVRLYLGNGFSGTSEAGQRVFDVSVEGVVPAAFNDLDPVALFGATNTGGVVAATVAVSDGVLDLAFLHDAIENPLINGIEIVATDAVVDPTASVISISAPTPTVVESGDGGTTTSAVFNVTFDQAPTSPVTVSYTVNIDGVETTGSLNLGTTGAPLVIPVTNDDVDNGAETVQVTIDAVTVGDPTSVSISPVANTATVTVTDDDEVVVPGGGDAQAAFDAVEIATPDFSVPGQVGEALITVIPGEDDVQISNFDPNSWTIENQGAKRIAAVYIDVSTALYPDSVFDPDGTGGENVFKPLQFDDGSTETDALDPASYQNLFEATGNTLPLFGPGAQGGFRGLLAVYDSNGANGGFQFGESSGISIDMDPNSLAGFDQSSLNAATTPTWDAGGISGAELIGSEITVLFADGSTATGQLMSDGSQAGAQALVTQASPGLEASLTVNGVAPGGTGVYGGAVFPNVEVSGPAGETVRVVLTKGLQPVDGDLGVTTEARLAGDAFPANNAAEFQVVDVVIPESGSVNISGFFDYNNNPNGFDFDGNDTLPLGFVASVIDSSNGNLPLGPVSAPIYLQNSGGPVIVSELGVVPIDVSILEAGDDGTVTEVEFFVGVSPAPSAAVEILYSVFENGVLVSSNNAATIPIGGATLTVDFANDDVADGPDQVQVVVDQVLSPVGVVVGDQGSASVTITDDDSGPITLALVDNDSGDVLAFIPENGLVNPTIVPPGTPFNILALVDESQLPGGVGSVVFDYPGLGDGGRVESSAPFAAFGDPGTPDSGEEFPAGPFEVTATVFSGGGGGGDALATRTVTVDLASPPTATPLADVEVALGGDPATVVADASTAFSDVDAAIGDTLSFALVPAVPGFAIDPTTGVVIGAPSVLGPVALNIVATDDFGLMASTTLTVVGTNTAPVLNGGLPDGEGTIGEAIAATAFAPFFSDPNGDALTYSISGQPNGVTINPVTGVVSGAPTEGGVFSATVTATDPSGAAASGLFVIDVNTPPTAAGSIGDAEIPLGDAVSVDASAVFSDIDGDALTYALASGPSALSIDANGLVTGTPPAIGNFTIAVVATDPSGASATSEFVLSVVDPADLNEAPSVSTPIADATFEVGDAISIPLGGVFSDPEGGELAFAVSSVPAGLTLAIDPSGGVVGAANATGAFIVTVTATDPFGAVATDVFTIEVDEDNNAPVVDAPIASASVEVGDAFSIDVSNTFSDPDGDTLSFSLSGAPAGLTIGSDGVISGEPTQTGAFNVVVTASDGLLFANNPFTLNVTEEEPVIPGGEEPTDGDDVLVGTDGVDEIEGLGGDDDITGLDGNDTLRGGAGNDTVGGGGGDDMVFGGGGNDTVGGGVGNDMVRGGKGDDTVRGGSGDDKLKGGDGDDVVRGGGGDDMLFGDDGNDILRGGNGDDMLRGGDGDDNLGGGGGTDKVLGGDGDDVLNGGAGNDMVRGGEGDDTVRGGGGDDTVVGGAGSDNVNGGGGDDIVVAGLGDDVLRGGGGIDTFLFDGQFGNDEIVGFADGVDKLELAFASDLNAFEITQVDGDTLISIDENRSIELRNFDAALLDETDFVF